MVPNRRSKTPVACGGGYKTAAKILMSHCWFSVATGTGEKAEGRAGMGAAAGLLLHHSFPCPSRAFVRFGFCFLFCWFGFRIQFSFGFGQTEADTEEPRATIYVSPI